MNLFTTNKLNSMSKINVSRTGVFQIEYKGPNKPGLQKGFHYTVIIIDGHTDDSVECQLHFPNYEYTPMTYAGVIPFSEDWTIISAVTFPKSFLPVKSAN